MGTRKTGISGTAEYVTCMNKGGLPCAWAGLGRVRKRYARDLVRLLGWPVHGAIQHAYAFPFDEWLYDERRQVLCKCSVNRKTGVIQLTA